MGSCAAVQTRTPHQLRFFNSTNLTFRVEVELEHLQASSQDDEKSLQAKIEATANPNGAASGSVSGGTKRSVHSTAKSVLFIFIVAPYCGKLVSKEFDEESLLNCKISVFYLDKNLDKFFVMKIPFSSGKVFVLQRNEVLEIGGKSVIYTKSNNNTADLSNPLQDNRLMDTVDLLSPIHHNELFLDLMKQLTSEQYPSIAEIEGLLVPNRNEEEVIAMGRAAIVNQLTEEQRGQLIKSHFRKRIMFYNDRCYIRVLNNDPLFQPLATGYWVQSKKNDIEFINLTDLKNQILGKTVVISDKVVTNQANSVQSAAVNRISLSMALDEPFWIDASCEFDLAQ